MEEINFSEKKLIKLIFPLIIEQFLIILVGIVDTVMVSNLGEYAVSAVSLVDSINVLLKQVLSATAAGGAIVAAQYLGQNQRNRACRAAKQLTHLTIMIATLLSVFCIAFNPYIVRTIFGSIDNNVYKSSVTYFYYTALTYPFLAVYNSAAALFRAMGNSRISMLCSLFMNLLHILGNAVLIYGFGMGVRGAAVSTLVSTVVGSLSMLNLITKTDNKIFIIRFWQIRFDRDMIKRIFSVGIPTGVENGLFQAGRLILSSLVSTFGTAAIAANAVANTLGGFMSLPAAAISLAMPAVVGQSMGAGNTVAAEKNIKIMMKMAIKYCMYLIAPLMLLMRYILAAYNLGSEAYHYAYVICMIHGAMAFWLWPYSFTLPNALRATGDTKTTMLISLFSMVFIRLAFSYILARYFNLGVYSVWIAMYCDWSLRAILFYLRFRTGKWKFNKVI